MTDLERSRLVVQMPSDKKASSGELSLDPSQAELPGDPYRETQDSATPADAYQEDHQGCAGSYLEVDEVSACGYHLCG